MSGDNRLLTWLGVIRRCPVVVSSPLPPDEFLQRLAQVTTKRGVFTSYLDPRTAPRPDPCFYGVISRSYVRLTRLEGTSWSGQRYLAWLTAEPWVSDDGGTELRGWIAPPENVVPLVAGIMYLACLGLLAVGIAQLVLGNVNGVGSTLVSPFFAIAVAANNTRNRRLVDRETGNLVRELKEVVGSTVTFIDE
jgi:hypothetical protein